jgi:Arc/MetJ-type ribon-helix-helix transcriptional regulator
MVSLRLDGDAVDALALLTEGGRSRSDVIREALLEAARRRRSELLRADAEAAAADPADLAEAKAVLQLMESMREPW